MPHTIEDFATTQPITRSPKPKPKSKPLSREHQHLLTTFTTIQTLYTESQLSLNIASHITYLVKSAKSPIHKILSLGLGSLTAPEKGQTRRLKQLAIFLAIRAELSRKSGIEIHLYAQDPVFTRADESFLSSFSVGILRTTSGTSLGEAETIIDSLTLVYSPFLTLEAYEALLLGRRESVHAVRYLIGDDFAELEAKWPKRSEERRLVEKVVKGSVRGYKRRVVTGEGFWEDVDAAFGMGVYVKVDEGRGKGKSRL